MSLLYKIERAAHSRDATKKKFQETLDIPVKGMDLQHLKSHDGRIKRTFKNMVAAQNEFDKTKQICLDYINSL